MSQVPFLLGKEGRRTHRSVLKALQETARKLNTKYDGILEYLIVAACLFALIILHAS